ncbi:biotin--[acetyl-CoA-carboxylase] ligase [Rubrivirga marina]|uniref:biotin--[biotin carboxyl-carrier protein] ligase n=1 Tax=Rubrivirga marina TaxID=1196024 RepID=A0A271J405_9BACT|nr:biotin--[acetyl-CoA-carboxylase] ligase [Rubrivirga marina]PAP78242.1 biotin--[acetyl-CoA-carboxylase] ligase [Rubrivirga marina]
MDDPAARRLRDVTAAATLGTPIRHLASAGSTMDEAAAWAAEGAPHGAVVVAEHQHGGRGRHGRAWEAPPGQSLLVTVVLRPDLAADRVGLVPLAAGLAVAEAVDAFGADARLKWPNDVRVGGRKLAGVLAETTWSRGQACVLLGVGLNVGQDAFPPPLDQTATSLRLETGQPVPRLAPLRPILDRLAGLLALAEADPAALVSAVEARLERVGDAIEVRDPGSGALVVAGRVLGLAPTGALRLLTPGGERDVYAGEVTLAAP